MAEWLMAVVLKTVAAPRSSLDFFNKSEYFYKFCPASELAGVG